MNDKNKKFCLEYLANGFNGTQAYLATYTSVKKEDTAAVNASKLLRNTKVQEYIKAEQDKSAAKLEITRESLIADLQEIKLSTKETNPQAALKAIEMTAKMLGLAGSDKTETKITGDININKLFGFEEDDKAE
jgi:phage terminase small subunit